MRVGIGKSWIGDGELAEAKGESGIRNSKKTLARSEISEDELTSVGNRNLLLLRPAAHLFHT